MLLTSGWFGCVQLHHLNASHFLIDTIHKHGFCCSYNEVYQFEQNAVLRYGTDILERSLGMTMMIYEKLYSFKGKGPTVNLDLLWKSSLMLESPRPAWSGIMVAKFI